MTTSHRAFVSNAIFVAAAILATASHAQAGFIMIVQQVGSDVVETGSGTINLSALTSQGSFAYNIELVANVGFASAGPAGAPSANIYSSVSGPTALGSGGQFYASSGTGDEAGVYGNYHELILQSGYISGAGLSDTSTFANQTLAGLGLTLGTYTWTWGTGATADFFQLEIVSSPEPSTFGLLALAAAGLMLGCWFRRGSVVKMDAACSSPSGRISPTEL